MLRGVTGDVVRILVGVPFPRARTNASSSSPFDVRPKQRDELIDARVSVINKLGVAVVPRAEPKASYNIVST